MIHYVADLLGSREKHFDKICDKDFSSMLLETKKKIVRRNWRENLHNDAKWSIAKQRWKFDFFATNFNVEKRKAKLNAVHSQKLCKLYKRMQVRGRWKHKCFQFPLCARFYCARSMLIDSTHKFSQRRWNWMSFWRFVYIVAWLQHWLEGHADFELNL